MIKFILGVLLLVSFKAYSATQATLLLKGTVPQLLSVEVTPESTAQNLDLSTSANNVKIAEVREKSNSSTGYKILVKSANGGKLINGSEEFPYSIRYASSAVNLTSADQEVKNVSTRGVVDSEVDISYTGVEPELMKEGDYTNTITFTIQVN